MKIHFGENESLVLYLLDTFCLFKCPPSKHQDGSYLLSKSLAHQAVDMVLENQALWNGTSIRDLYRFGECKARGFLKNISYFKNLPITYLTTGRRVHPFSHLPFLSPPSQPSPLSTSILPLMSSSSSPFHPPSSLVPLPPLHLSSPFFNLSSSFCAHPLLT